ncbi:tRNA 2'-phosphotransferase [Drechslerella dactyloides]|uniref:2'-phosphotransferase n=1 Tax=Drechslerella dactyloides TaxID=74499 RepID=A0AAD6NIH0_DREDA|nr:tRNA 2'-phosphotransferase [Drechslerella dactyloides]
MFAPRTPTVSTRTFAASLPRRKQTPTTLSSMSRARSSKGRGREMGRMEQISHALSRTLRHTAREEKLNMRPDGYVNVQELLSSERYKRLNLDFPTLCQVVQDNTKKRFKLIRETVPSDGDPLSPPDESSAAATFDLTPDLDSDPDLDLTQYYIRATQGHSIPIQEGLLLAPIESNNLPSLCVHGTYYSALTLILESGGLKKMGRNHIHCAAGLPKASIHPETGEEIPAVLSGMRFNAEVLFYIDVEKALRDGIKFWRSDNHVILTNGREEDGGVLTMDYVIRVEDVAGRAGGGDLWTRDEGVIKEWPATRKAKDGSKANPRGGKGKGKGARRADINQELEDA